MDSGPFAIFGSDSEEEMTDKIDYIEALKQVQQMEGLAISQFSLVFYRRHFLKLFKLWSALCIKFKKKLGKKASDLYL